MRFKKFFLIPLLVLPLVVFLSGCAKQAGDFEAQSLSQKGLMAEDFLPQDTLLALSFNNFSENQRTLLQTLEKVFPSRDGKSLLQDFSFSLWKNISALGLSYEEDIQPLLGDTNRLFLAITGGGPSSRSYLSFVIQNSEKFSQVLEKLRAQKGYREEDYKGQKLYHFDQFSLVVKDDLLFIVNNSDEAKKSLDRFESKENLRSTPSFRQLIERFKTPYVGVFYISMPLLLEETKNFGTSRYSDYLIKNSRCNDPLVYGFLLRAAENGFKLEGSVLGDKDRMKKEGKSFKECGGKGGYFLSSVSAQNLVFYNESPNFRDDFQAMDIVTPEFQESFQKWLKLDFEKDFLDWTDNPYLFAVYRNEGSLIPGLTLILDASKDLASARTLAKNLGDQLTSILNLIKIQYDFFDSALSIGEVQFGEDTLQSITLDLSQFTALSDASGSDPLSNVPFTLPPLLEDEKITISFGLKGKNFVISTANDIAQIFNNQTLAKDADYQMLKEQIGNKKGDMALLEFREMVDYFDNLVDTVEGLSDTYNEIRPYVEPLQSLLFQSRAEDYEIVIEGFLGVGAGN